MKTEFYVEMRFEIKGLMPFERKWAERVLVSVYQKTASSMNNGGIEKYNSEWFLKHPEKDSCMILQEEYMNEYDKVFKKEADKESWNQARLFTRRIAKLRESEPLTFSQNMTEGTITGYVESY